MNELEEMRSFIQLVDSGSATKAANVRGLAVSAISRRLKDLETRLGVQLLNRTTRRMSLTDEGRLFYDHAIRILDDLKEAEAQVSQTGGALSGTLKIAVPVSFGIAHLSPAVSAFMHAHHDIAIHLDMSDRRVDLVEEGFDLAIRIGSLADSSLIARKIGTFRHVACASPDFFSARQIPQHPDDISGWPGLCYGNMTRPNIWKHVGPDGEAGSVTVEPRLVANNGDALREAAIAGLGILSSPSFIVHRAIEEKLLQPVLLDFQWFEMAIYAVYPPTRHLSQRVRRFIDFLASRFGDHPYWDDFLAGPRVS